MRGTRRTDEEMKAMVKSARAFCAEMDKTDGGVIKDTVDIAIRTVMTAIWAGLRVEESNSVAEGLVMLDEIHSHITGSKKSYLDNLMR